MQTPANCHAKHGLIDVHWAGDRGLRDAKGAGKAPGYFGTIVHGCASAGKVENRVKIAQHSPSPNQEPTVPCSVLFVWLHIQCPPPENTHFPPLFQQHSDQDLSLVRIVVTVAAP